MCIEICIHRSAFLLSVHPFPHSLTILKQMAEDLPPLAPEPTERALRETYERYRVHPPASQQEAEDAIVAFGRILWPYRKAFEDLVVRALAPEHRSVVATVPSRVPRNQRAAHCAALLESRQDAERRVREVVSKDDAEYRHRIQQFQAIQHEIDGHLGALQRLVERVGAFPGLADDIREAIREFQRGFAALAREPAAADVCAAVETYRERHNQAHRTRTREALPKVFG